MDHSTSHCPRSTPWCTQHEHDADQCVSAAVPIAGGHVNVWLLQELAGVEPTITVDGPPAGADLTLDQATELCEALQRLRAAGLADAPVQS
jgi:hypothetical protein